MTTIRQWTVKTPHGTNARVFEDESRAWAYARIQAEAGAPSVITDPPDGGGQQWYVFRADPMVEVSSRHVLAGTTRRVVEP